MTVTPDLAELATHAARLRGALTDALDLAYLATNATGSGDAAARERLTLDDVQRSTRSTKEAP